MGVSPPTDLENLDRSEITSDLEQTLYMFRKVHSIIPEMFENGMKFSEMEGQAGFQEFLLSEEMNEAIGILTSMLFKLGKYFARIFHPNDADEEQLTRYGRCIYDRSVNGPPIKPQERLMYSIYAVRALKARLGAEPLCLLELTKWETMLRVWGTSQDPPRCDADCNEPRLSDAVLDETTEQVIVSLSLLFVHDRERERQRLRIAHLPEATMDELNAALAKLLPMDESLLEANIIAVLRETSTLPSMLGQARELVVSRRDRIRACLEIHGGQVMKAIIKLCKNAC